MSATKFVVIGGQGFLGTWVCKYLLETVKPQKITVLDLKCNDGIYDQVLTAEQKGALERFYGDVCDGKFVTERIVAAEPTHIIHLAALQIPSCQANPILGARVNVIGTLNVFEAAKAVKAAGKPCPRVVYASSAGVASGQANYGGADCPVKDDEHHHPDFHYGVYKIANEGNARVYHRTDGIDSIGLRPLTIYGVGREVGKTSGPTKAIKASILGLDYVVQFNGMTGFNYVEDIAVTFVKCALAKSSGALAFNTKHELLNVTQFMDCVKALIPAASKHVTIADDAAELPIAYNFSSDGLAKLLGGDDKIPFTPVKDALPKIVAIFEGLKARNALSAADLKI